MTDPMTTTQAPEGVIELLANALACIEKVPGMASYALLDKAEDDIRKALAALSVPVNGQGSEPVAWGCFENGQIDERLVYRDEKRTRSAALTFNMTVQPLYAAQQAPISDDTQAGTDERSEGVDHDSPEKALEDAQQYGIGFIVDGRRVSPDRVTVCRGPDHDLEALRERVASMAWHFRGSDRHGGPWYEGAKPTDSPAMADCFGFADAILSTLQSKPGGVNV